MKFNLNYVKIYKNINSKKFLKRVIEMKISFKKSIAFFSYDLNHEKFLLIENYAKQALEIKNKST